MSEEKLLELKKRIQERTKKNSVVLDELRNLNKSFNKLSDLLSKSEKIKEIKDNKEFIESFDKVSTELRSVSERIDKLDFSKLPTPNVIIPEKRSINVSNIKEAKADEVKINWQDKPQEDYRPVTNSLTGVFKSLETTLSGFFSKILSIASSVLEYIKEPDEVEIGDNTITEFYGTRKVVYRIRDDGIKRRITRET